MAEIDYTVDKGPPTQGYEEIGEVTLTVSALIPDVTEFGAYFTMNWCEAVWGEDGPMPVKCNVSAGAGAGSTKIVLSVKRGAQHESCHLDVRELIGPVVELALRRMEAERTRKGLCPDCGGSHDAGRCEDYSIPKPVEPQDTIERDTIEDESMSMKDVANMIDTFEYDDEDGCKWCGAGPHPSGKCPDETDAEIDYENAWDDPDPDWMTITLPYDIHARVVSGVVQLATEYNATILFRHDGEQYSWDSFFSVMERLATKEKGDEIEVGALGSEKHVARAQVLQVLTQDQELKLRGPRGADSPFAPKFEDED